MADRPSHFPGVLVPSGVIPILKGINYFLYQRIISQTLSIILPKNLIRGNGHGTLLHKTQVK